MSEPQAGAAAPELVQTASCDQWPELPHAPGFGSSTGGPGWSTSVIFVPGTYGSPSCPGIVGSKAYHGQLYMSLAGEPPPPGPPMPSPPVPSINPKPQSIST